MIPLNPLFLPTPKSLNCLEKYGMVNSIIMAIDTWNEVTLEELFNDNTIHNIKKILWFGRVFKDTVVWLLANSGRFSVKSASTIINPSPENVNKWWKFLWSSKMRGWNSSCGNFLINVCPLLLGLRIKR